ncbi:hypothetical protein [Paraburkholderia nemoris]|uniref:hypothetical protein n=1 Tax=Paraburkholderia nemoris TaxID=2793076 RepID=UPI001B8CBCC8|nr:hypothetical protein [Paraburkholderia nemoris]
MMIVIFPTTDIRISVIESAYARTSFRANVIGLYEYREQRVTPNRRVEEVADGDARPGLVAETVRQATIAACPKLRYVARGLAGRPRLRRRFAPAGSVDVGIRKNLRLEA